MAFLLDRISSKIFCGKRGCPAAHEGIEHGIATEGEHFNEPARKLFGEHGKMPLLFGPGKVPVAREVGVPLFGGHS